MEQTSLHASCTSKPSATPCVTSRAAPPCAAARPAHTAERRQVTRWLRGGNVSVAIIQAVLPSLAISKRFRGKNITVKASVWPWLEVRRSCTAPRASPPAPTGLNPTTVSVQQTEETQAVHCSSQGHAAWLDTHRRLLSLEVGSCARDTLPLLALEVFTVPKSSRKPPRCITRGVLPLVALHEAVGSRVEGWLLLTGGVGVDRKGTSALRRQSTPPIASDAIKIAISLSIAKQSVPMRAPASVRALASLPVSEPLLKAALALLPRREGRTGAPTPLKGDGSSWGGGHERRDQEEEEEERPVGTLWLHVQDAQLRQNSVSARMRVVCAVDGVRAASGESHGSLRPSFDYRCAFAVRDVRSRLTISLIDPKARGAAAAATAATTSPSSPPSGAAQVEEELPGQVGTVDVSVADVEYHAQQAALASVGMAAVEPLPLHIPVFAPGKRDRDPVATLTIVAVFERDLAAIASAKPVEVQKPVEAFAVKAFRVRPLPRAPLDSTPPAPYLALYRPAPRAAPHAAPGRAAERCRVRRPRLQ